MRSTKASMSANTTCLNIVQPDSALSNRTIVSSSEVCPLAHPALRFPVGELGSRVLDLSKLGIPSLTPSTMLRRLLHRNPHPIQATSSSFFHTRKSDLIFPAMVYPLSHLPPSPNTYMTKSTNDGISPLLLNTSRKLHSTISWMTVMS